MNRERLAIGYRALEGVTPQMLDMSSFQNIGGTGEAKKTISELKECGTAACASGYLALSPEFRALGGIQSQWGSALFGEYGIRYRDDSLSLAQFYECESAIEEIIIQMVHILHENEKEFYNVLIYDDITPKMVQEKFALLYFIEQICKDA